MPFGPCNKPAGPKAIVLAAVFAVSTILAVGAAGAVGAAEAAETAGTISPDRQTGLLYLLRQDCGSCHGMTMKGGLGPGLLPANLAGKPDEALLGIILDGVPGTPMPPWRPLLAPAEAAWMVKKLKEGL